MDFIRGLCRAICFIVTAFLSAFIISHAPTLFIAICGAVIGGTAYIGWKEE